MSVVLDASMTLSWYFHDEATAQRHLILDYVSSNGDVVPIHWRFEVANGFVMAVRRQRIAMDFALEALQHLAALPIETDASSSDLVEVLPLADQYALTAYDAAYLGPALRCGLALASLDRALPRAASAARVEIMAA